MNNYIPEKLNKLLADYFRHPLKGGSHLNRLEGDVWHRIELRKAEAPVGLLERVLAFIFQPQYRLASVAATIMIGLFAGNMTSSVPPSEIHFLSSNALNFEIFSLNSSNLISTRLNNSL